MSVALVRNRIFNYSGPLLRQANILGIPHGRLFNREYALTEGRLALNQHKRIKTNAQTHG